MEELIEQARKIVGGSQAEIIYDNTLIHIQNEQATQIGIILKRILVKEANNFY